MYIKKQHTESHGVCSIDKLLISHQSLELFSSCLLKVQDHIQGRMDPTIHFSTSSPSLSLHTALPLFLNSWFWNVFVGKTRCLAVLGTQWLPYCYGLPAFLHIVDGSAPESICGQQNFFKIESIVTSYFPFSSCCIYERVYTELLCSLTAGWGFPGEDLKTEEEMIGYWFPWLSLCWAAG